MTDELVLTVQEAPRMPTCPVCGYGLRRLDNNGQAWRCDRAFSDIRTPREHVIYWSVDPLTGMVLQ